MTCNISHSQYFYFYINYIKIYKRITRSVLFFPGLLAGVRTITFKQPIKLIETNDLLIKFNDYEGMVDKLRQTCDVFDILFLII